MAHLHKKIKKGRPCYYVREIARVNGKPKVINQVYIGSAERILELAQGSKSLPRKIQAQGFGALWLANLVEKEIDLAGLIDRIVLPENADASPSVGEYFLYAIYNRMIGACSKHAMSVWYRHTAIQHIRSVQIDELNSQIFRQKWDQVGEEQLQQIAADFLHRVAELEPSSSDCFIFDTTNYFSLMATVSDQGNRIFARSRLSARRAIGVSRRSFTCGQSRPHESTASLTTYKFWINETTSCKSCDRILSTDTKSDLAQRGKSKEGRNWLRQVGRNQSRGL